MALTDKEKMELLNLRKRVEAQRTTIRELQDVIASLQGVLEQREGETKVAVE